MNLPSIAWTNLSLQVKEWSPWKELKSKKKTILRRLSGSFAVGTLNGLLGPSGAGKTTLLNALSGSNTSGLTGDSAIYTLEKSPTSYFIAQHVHASIVGELTVGQILRYAYRFKNSPILREEVNKAIGSLLQSLLLDPAILKRPFALCSGGEQKRVAIAQELMARQAPDFLFLDEPTTGLDSAAAYEVMSSLGALARTQSLTVIASIHSPNHETLHLFDKLYVLAKGGLAIYSGPPAGIRSTLQVELNLTFPKHQPPIEMLLKIACNDPASSTVSRLAVSVLSRQSFTLKPALESLNLQPLSLPTPHKAFSLSNFLTQLSRQLTITFIAKLRTFLFMPLFFLVFFAILATIFSPDGARGSGCYHLKSANATCAGNDKSLTQENVYYLSYVIQMVGMAYLTTSTVFYSTYLTSFKAEHRNGWYSLGVFYWSLGITSLLELCAISSFLTLVTYFFSFQHAADGYSINLARLALYGFFLWLLCFFYQSLGQFIGILVDSPMMAFLACQFATGVLSFFNGLFLKMERMQFDALKQLNDALGILYTTRGVFYAIYGFDRCETGSEESWVMKDYEVDVEKMGEYVWRVLLNIFLLRVISLLILWLKFSSVTRNRSTASDNLEIGIESFKIDEPRKAKAKIPENLENAMKTGAKVQLSQYTANKILIGWRNLSLFSNGSAFEMGSKGRKVGKPILRNLNGQFEFGTLNALMGTSGAGKTSLLKVLNGRCKTRLSEQTEVYTSSLTTIKTAFITQEVSGHLMPGLTAMQTLTYASRLKNRQSGVDHEGIARKWLQELGLLGTASTKVEKCSGGERKRLAVALELTALEPPNCLCIDEPTSGLDTNSAEMVISILRNLAQSHSLTIITSIHQPTSEILFMFDQLYVLARGGVAIYSGPPTGIGSHLSQLPNRLKSPEFPIELLIKYSCSDHTHPTVGQLVSLTNRQFTGDSSAFQLLSQARLTPDGIRLNRCRFSLTSAVILSRRYLLYLRGYLWKLWLFLLINILGYALALRTLFNPSTLISVSGCINPEDDLGKCAKMSSQIEDELSLSDNLQYVNFFTNIYLLMVLFLSSLNFYFEFPTFRNEHRNGWYSTGSYYLMKSLFEVIPLVVANFAYVAIINIYHPVVPGSLYWPLWTLLTLGAIGYMGLAHCCFLLLPQSRMCQTILMLTLYLCFVILGNSFLPLSGVHYAYQFIANFNISRFTLEGVLLLQYGFGRCPAEEISGVLYALSLTDADYGRSLLMLTFNCLLYRLAAVWLLIRAVNPIENRRKRVHRIVKYQEMIQSRGRVERKVVLV